MPGEEGVGTVVAVGAGVTDLPAGQLVAIVPGTTGGLWAEHLTRRRADVVPLPAGVDPLQAAMLSTNPITAIGMLDDVCRCNRATGSSRTAPTRPLATGSSPPPGAAASTW